MLDQANRTFICSVVFIDLVGYSKKTVTEQIRLKTSLTNNLSEAIKDIPVNDRIILDTGDGAAISFLGDPEDALFVTLSLREAMVREGLASSPPESAGDDTVRMGINLGPVKLVKDINGHPNIIGDGINVSQRIMSFARPGQIVVSRSYYDVVSNLASEYAKLFSYEGSRTDKHVREHEIYVVGHHEGALQKAKDGMKDRASSTQSFPRRTSTMPPIGNSTVTLTIPSFVQDKKKLSIVAGVLTALVLILGILVAAKPPKNGGPIGTASAPIEPPKASGAISPPPPETKLAEAPKPDAKVLQPGPSIVPSPAPDAKAAPAKPGEAAKPGEPAKPGDGAKADASRTDAAKGDVSKTAAPAAIPATLVFAVTPWGEIFVNGKQRGVVPPMKALKLDPGKYKIEIKNTTFPVHTENLDLKARDEVTVRHRFQ
jgi:class 3 adenylate cyclase